MSEAKDLLAQTQGSQKEYPKLNIFRHFEVKENPKTEKTAFTWYEKSSVEGEPGTHKYFSGDIEGIYIASAMKLSGFDQNLGKNGGRYTSSMYYRNDDTISLFSPPLNGPSKKVFTGTPDKAVEWLNANGCMNAIKKHRVLFILTQSGLCKFETNVVISIDQLNACNKNKGLQDFMVILTPMEMDPKSPEWSKATLSRLGKFITKNPPKYAAIKLGGPITDKITKEFKLMDVLKEYLAWKGSRDLVVAEDSVATTGGVPGLNNQADRPTPGATNTPDMDNPVDDLPF